MEDKTDVSVFNPYYIVGALALIATAGGAYWFFTQKPKSQTDEAIEEQKRANAAAAAIIAAATDKAAAGANAGQEPAKDYTSFATSRAAFPSAPKTAGKRSVGDSIVIRAGVKPRRLNEKLEYVEDGEAKRVQVRLGSLWGWAAADHSLITKGGVAAPNIIVKSDDIKIAPFYEIKGSDALTGDESVASKVKDKVLSYFSDEGDGYIGSDGFLYAPSLPAHVFDEKAKRGGYKKRQNETASVGVVSVNKRDRSFANYNADGFDEGGLGAKAGVGNGSEISIQDLTPHNSWEL